jgi:hypothetical protein
VWGQLFKGDLFVFKIGLAGKGFGGGGGHGWVFQARDV